MPSATRTRATVRPAIDLEHKIRTRAYQLFEERGYTHGFALEDWLRAEAEIVGTAISVPKTRPRARA